MSLLKKILLTGLSALAMSLILPSSSDARVVVRVQPRSLPMIKAKPSKTVVVSSPSMTVIKVKPRLQKTWVPGHFRKVTRQRTIWVPGRWVSS